MNFPPIYEFGSVMVFEPGVPNAERVVFRPTQEIDLSAYGIWAAWQNNDGTIRPIANFSFWFGVLTVQPPCWIVVFTGKGDFRQMKHSETGVPVYCFHWGNETTIFNYRQVVPVVYRFESFSIGDYMSPVPILPPPPTTPQITPPSDPNQNTP